LIERGVDGRGRAQWAAVDGEDVVALADIDPRRIERRARFFRRVVAAIDLANPIEAVDHVVVSAEESCGGSGSLWNIAAGRGDVRDSELAIHLADEGIQVAACRDVSQLGLVPPLHSRPIESTHGGIEEVVAQHAPGLVENLLPLGAGVELHLEVGELQRAFADFPPAIRVENTDRLAAAIDNAIGASVDRIVVDLFDQCLFFARGEVE
jgi:hypothetical protein